MMKNADIKFICLNTFTSKSRSIVRNTQASIIKLKNTLCDQVDENQSECLLAHHFLRFSLPIQELKDYKLAQVIVYDNNWLLFMHQDLEDLIEEEEPQKKSEYIHHPQKKIYAIQVRFLENFRKNLKQIQDGIQKLLNAVNSIKAQKKRRLPYNIMIGFDKTLKEVRQLKFLLIEENKKYDNQFKEREKIKNLKNKTFKKYLIALHNKKQELKLYISGLEARIQHLQQTGYAQYVDYSAKVQDQPTIRFSYNETMLLKLTNKRVEFSKKVLSELRKGQQLRQQIEGILKQKQQEAPSPTLVTIKKNNSVPEVTKKILMIKQIALYFQGQRQLIFKNKKIKQRNREHKQHIESLKNSIKMALQQRKQMISEQLIDKYIKNAETEDQQIKVTKTDYYIYLKQVNRILKNRLENKLFMEATSLKKDRSKSC